MARTSTIEVHSEAPVTGFTKSKKISIDDQLEAVRRLFNVLVAFCVGNLILSVVSATLFGVYISEHVRCSLKCLSNHFQKQKGTQNTNQNLYILYVSGRIYNIRSADEIEPLVL